MSYHWAIKLMSYQKAIKTKSSSWKAKLQLNAENQTLNTKRDL